VLDVRRYLNEEQRLTKSAIKELLHTVLLNRPNFLFTINHIGYIPEFFTKMKLPHASWFIDNPFLWLREEHASSFCFLFVFERDYIQKLNRAGFKNVFFLPNATNPKVFRKIDLPPTTQKRYGCLVSFVGSSGYDFYIRCYKRITRLSRNEKFKKFCDEVIKIQSENPLLYISDILAQVKKKVGYEPKFSSTKESADFKTWLEFASMTVYRREVVEELRDFDIHLYGDDGWKEIIKGGIKFLGKVDYYKELPLIYNATTINLNITRAQMKTALNQRVFDVAACGSFLLSDYREDLERLFDVDEIAYFRDKRELREKVLYFLRNKKEREDIAHRARVRVLHEHTYRNRAEEIIRVMKDFC
jgi:spore maturation protein CgeB